MAYIYEHIRTQGFEPMYFEEHYARLDMLARKHLLTPLSVERDELRRLIGERLRSGGFSADNNNAVYIRYGSAGVVEVECVDTLYNEFSLRALRPRLFVCHLSGELLTDNTSAKEALLEFNRTTALTSEQGVALWANEQGEVLAIDGAAVIAIFEDEIRFSHTDSIEAGLAYDVAESIGRKVSKEPISLSDIAQAKELLYIDYRGITAIDAIDSHHLMDITALKFATKIAEREATI